MEARHRPFLLSVISIGGAIAGIFLVNTLSVARPREFLPPHSYEEIVSGLREQKAAGLTQFLEELPRALDEIDLSDRQVDSLLDELEKIQETDPYQEAVSAQIGAERTFVNRQAAWTIRLILPERVERRRLRVWLDSLRELPLEERTTKILSRIESLQKLLEVTHPLVRGLSEVGGAGVPFILRYPSQDNFVRLSIVEALSQIQDPRGVDYIVSVLQTKGEYAFPYRIKAVQALANFRGEKVVKALLEVLKEDPFPVTRQAARSLTAVTGEHFGLLFNEDSKTWEAWVQAPDKKTFKPTRVERSQQKMEALIERLFERYLSARIKTPDNGEDLLLAQKEGMKLLSQDLRSLGKPVVPLLVFQCRIRMEQNPAQEKELKIWTEKLLRLLGWPEAQRAAAFL